MVPLRARFLAPLEKARGFGMTPVFSEESTGRSRGQECPRYTFSFGGWPGLSRSVRRPGKLYGFLSTQGWIDSQLLAPARRPWRLNLHARFLPRQVMAKAAPPPILG